MNPRNMTLAEIEADPVALIQHWMLMYPQIWWGGCTPRQQIGLHPSAAELETVRAQDRTETLHERGQQQVIFAAQFLSVMPRQKTVNTRRSSYAWKHAAEAWFETRGQSRYIGEGSFVIACFGLGFVVRAAGPHFRVNLAEAAWRMTR